MNVKAIEGIIARWEEYGPLNTIRGVMADPNGGRCAVGDIANVEGGITHARLLVKSHTMHVVMKQRGMCACGECVAWDAAQNSTGLSARALVWVASTNDAWGERPTNVLRALAEIPENVVYTLLVRVGPFGSNEQFGRELDNYMGRHARVTMRPVTMRPAWNDDGTFSIEMMAKSLYQPTPAFNPLALAATG